MRSLVPEVTRGDVKMSEEKISAKYTLAGQVEGMTLWKENKKVWSQRERGKSRRV